MAGPISKKGSEPTSLDTTRQMLDELDALMERMLSLPSEEPSPATPAASPAAPLKAELTILPEASAPASQPAPLAARPRLRDLRKPLQNPDPPPHVESLRVTVPTPEESDPPQSESEPLASSEQRMAKFLDNKREPLRNLRPRRPIDTPDPAAHQDEPTAPSAREMGKGFRPRPATSLALSAQTEDSPSEPSVPIAIPVRVEKSEIEPVSLEVIPPTTGPTIADLPDPQPTLRSWILFPLVAINLIFDAFTYLLGPIGKTFRTPAGRMILGFTGIALILLAGLWYLRDAHGWTWEWLSHKMAD